MSKLQKTADSMFTLIVPFWDSPRPVWAMQPLSGLHWLTFRGHVHHPCHAFGQPWLAYHADGQMCSIKNLLRVLLKGVPAAPPHRMHRGGDGGDRPAPLHNQMLWFTIDKRLLTYQQKSHGILFYVHPYMTINTQSPSKLHNDTPADVISDYYGSQRNWNAGWSRRRGY